MAATQGSRSRWGALLLALIIVGSGFTAAPAATQAAATGIRIVAVDENGDRVRGACFSIDVGAYELVPCDAGSASGLNGVAFAYQAAGTYPVRLLRVPPGFRTPAARNVTVVANQVTVVTFVFARGGSTVRLRTTTAAGALVPGACYMVSPQSGPSFYGCDSHDGTADGLIRFGGLRAGTTYYLSQFEAAPGYRKSAVIEVVTFASSGKTKVRTWVVAPV